MNFKLTKKVQCGKKCSDGKNRNFVLYFLNGKQILKQKYPYEEDWDKGFDKHTSITDEYILNGKIYQTRKKDLPFKWDKEERKMVPVLSKLRKVSYPISKERLKEFEIPKDLKIEIQ
jgi:hypothetical protein